MQAAGYDWLRPQATRILSEVTNLRINLHAERAALSRGIYSLIPIFSGSRQMFRPREGPNIENEKESEEETNDRERERESGEGSGWSADHHRGESTLKFMTVINISAESPWRVRSPK